METAPEINLHAENWKYILGGHICQTSDGLLARRSATSMLHGKKTVQTIPTNKKATSVKSGINKEGNGGGQSKSFKVVEPEDIEVHIIQRGAVWPLIEMLQSPDAQLRDMSAFALGRLAQLAGASLVLVNRLIPEHVRRQASLSFPHPAAT